MMRSMRRLAGILSVALISAGLLILADAGLTLAWQEPISAIYGKIHQNKAASDLREIEQSFLADSRVARIGASGNVDKQAAALAAIFAEDLHAGKPIGQIRIPSIGADYVVVEGTDTASLQKGPGHYPETKLPGQGATIAIAGHRTTYLAPFNKIDEIGEGDEVLLEMPYASFTYVVTDTRIVDPSDVGVVDDTGDERLVLTACHPLYSAAQRYVVFADLQRISLFPGGEGRWLAP